MRSLSECTFNRVEYIKEIFKCIDRYSYDIDKEFSSLGCLGKLNKIDFNAGDTHNQGRMVISLTYTSGKKLLYKSRMLDIEKQYALFIENLNSRGIKGLHSLTAAKVLYCSNFAGIIEYIEYTGCKYV